MHRFIILTALEEIIAVPVKAIKSVLKLEEEDHPRVYFRENAVIDPQNTKGFYVWMHVLESVESLILYWKRLR